ncbi:PG1828 family lipoprotein [Porphyromonas sp.]
MKKFFAFAFVAVAAAFASCAGNNEQSATDSAAVDSTVVEQAPVVDSAAMVADSAAMTVDSVKK